MTTPDIPGAAVAAAHAAVALCHEDHPSSAKTPWACCITAGLAAALPHLGETRTQYGVQTTAHVGETMTMLCSGLIDAEQEVGTFVPAGEPRIVTRDVITTPWRIK